MKFLRYKLIPRSPLGSALQSDTLAGHLLCFIREKDGEDALKAVISDFLEGNPPFILSSAFPNGKLPFPVLPPPPRSDFRAFVEENANVFASGGYSKTTLFQALQKFKTFRKQPYLSLDEWKVKKQGFNLSEVFLEYVENKREAVEEKNESKKVETPHNVIDRRANRVLDEGGLFFMEETFFAEGFAFDLYVKVRPDFEERFQDLMAYMGESGFGRDRGIGKGVFEIEEDKEFNPSDIEHPQGNYLLNLSVFSTSEMEKWNGYYNLMTKYGRVWNGFGESNPFKKPFLAFREGSVFKKREIDYASCVLKKIHSNREIIQCTLPLMIPFHWEAP